MTVTVKGVTVDITDPGARKFLNSTGMRALLTKEARRLAQAAGPGFVATEADTGQTRARAAVIAATYAARRAEARDRTLSRALGSLRRG